MGTGTFHSDRNRRIEPTKFAVATGATIISMDRPSWAVGPDTRTSTTDQPRFHADAADSRFVSIGTQCSRPP